MNAQPSKPKAGFFSRLFGSIPLISWILGVLAAVILEQTIGPKVVETLAALVGKLGNLAYVAIYLLVILLVGTLTKKFVRTVGFLPSSEKVRTYLQGIPLLGWFIGALAAVGIEQFAGVALSAQLGLPKIPVLFGLLTMLKEPLFLSANLAYVLAIFIIPILVVAIVTRSLANAVAGGLMKMPLVVSAVVHLVILYFVFHFWADISDYRLITLKLMLVAILFTLSLNMINGYMGEFSCSHPGFMALGAYACSVFTVGFFVDDKVLGDALITSGLSFLAFPIGLFVGGVAASLGALIIAIPSFRTRGDYLAIISLAFLFIVKSFVENMEVMGGSRGLAGQPNWATLPVVFGVVVLGIWIINNYVTSIMGKAMNTVRDDESAAEAMTIDTRKTKIVTFMMAAFWAGVGGGLLAHIMTFINPSMFGLQKLAEVLAMVYFGGLNSVYGSIVGAVSISFLGEMLRPLEIFKWIIIPLILILVMIYRPTGLLAFKEFNVRNVLKPKNQ